MKAVNVRVRNAKSQLVRAKNLEADREASLREIITAGEAKAEALRSAVQRGEQLKFDDRMVRQHLVTFDDLRVRLANLIIDEGQDLLRESYVDVFDGLLKGGIKTGVWRVFYDPNQDIYKGQQPKAIRMMESALPAQFRLFTNCRNTQPIAVETSWLASTPCDETLSVGGPAIKKQWYATPGQQIRQISNHINVLLGEGVRPEEIVILSRRRLQNSCLTLGLRTVGFPITDITQSATTPTGRCLRFSTVAAFKGRRA
jgi:superfamily I DNA/RNA helicase